MSMVNPAVIGQYGQEDGMSAARSLKPVSSVEEYLARRLTYPEMANADSADQNSYRTTFRGAYNAAIAEMQGAGMTYYGKTPSQAAAEVEAQEATKKTIDEWEKETSIPSWSITRAAAANLNADLIAWDKSHDRNAPAITTTAAGKAWQAKMAACYAQWGTVYAAIQAGVGNPSQGMAEVRKARAAFGILRAEYDKLVAGRVTTPGVPVAPPVGPVVPPAGAKSMLPGLGIVAALALAGGGVWYFFFREPEDKQALGALPIGGV